MKNTSLHSGWIGSRQNQCIKNSELQVPNYEFHFFSFSDFAFQLRDDSTLGGAEKKTHGNPRNSEGNNCFVWIEVFPTVSRKMFCPYFLKNLVLGCALFCLYLEILVYLSSHGGCVQGCQLIPNLGCVLKFSRMRLVAVFLFVLIMHKKGV